MKKIALFIAAVLISMGSWAQEDLKFTPVNECYVSEGYYSGYITIPDQVILEGKTYLVTAIGDYAFRGRSNVTSVTMTYRIKKIGQYGLAGTGITAVTIPCNCSEIGGYALLSDNLHTINVDDNNQWFCVVNEGLFDKDLLTLYQYPADNYQATFVIPEGVKKIESGSLMNMKVQTIDFPSTIENFGQYQFSSCPYLTDMIVRLTDVPQRMDQNFEEFQKHCTLYVPAESVELYKQDSWWGGFKEIKSIDEYTSVKSVQVASPRISSIYDVKGNKVDDTSKGLNIIKYANGTSKKVIK